MEPTAAGERVLSHTQLARPFLAPELQLHLITHDSELWTATDEELERMGWTMPYWAFAWPGGQVLARYLFEHPGVVSERRVLDFGSGGAVEGIAAMRCGATSVLCADVDPIAACAAQLNATLNGVVLSTCTEDLVGRTDGGWQVVLAGDVCYERAMVRRVLPWLRELAGGGATVLLGDPGRLSLPRDGLQVVAEYDAPFDGDVRGTTLWKSWVARVSP